MPYRTPGVIPVPTQWTLDRPPLARKLEAAVLLFNEGKKKCSVCSEVKPLEEFHNHANHWTKKNKRCKPCQNSNAKAYRKRIGSSEFRWRGIEKEHGVSIWLFHGMLLEQRSECPICEQALVVTPKKTVKSPVVDHDHKTGKVRGILCGSCNFALGQLKDNPASMLRAANYIEDHATC